MNEDVLSFFDNYKSQINAHREKVPADCPELIAADKAIADYIEIASSYPNIWEFMQYVKDEDLMNKIYAVIAPLASKVVNDNIRSGNGVIPTIEQVCVAYHASYEAIDNIDKMPATKAVYERIFELEKQCTLTIEFIRLMAEEHLFVQMSAAPLAEMQDSIIQDSLDVSALAMSHHAVEMKKMAQNAKTAIEVEYESQFLVEQNAMEVANENMLMQDLYYPIATPLGNYILNPSEENRIFVVAGYRFVAEYFGVNVDELYDIPRVRDIIQKVLLNTGVGEEKRVVPESEVDEYIQVEKDAIKKAIEKEDIQYADSKHGIIKIWETEYALKDCMEGYLNPQRCFPIRMK